jgi:hypothetical protein
MAIKPENRIRIIAALKAQVPFEYSSISGWTARGDGEMRTEELPEVHTQELRGMDRAGMVAFIVMSYRTPIAWILKSGTLVMPDVKYSVTTTQHQEIVREALGQ